MAEATVVTLDVRDITPRERHPLIFAQVEALKVGDSLRLINDHDPKPLRYQLLAEYPDMFDWQPEKQGPEEWRILIRRVESE